MQFCPSFNWQLLDAIHIEKILRGLFASVTIFKVFRNMYLKQKPKKYFKRGNINTSGILDYLILRLEGKHNSNDRWIYASSCTYAH